MKKVHQIGYWQEPLSSYVSKVWSWLLKLKKLAFYIVHSFHGRANSVQILWTSSHVRLTCPPIKKQDSTHQSSLVHDRLWPIGLGRYIYIYIYIYIYTYIHIYMRVGTLIVVTIYLQLIQNRYMFRSFTVLQCSHQHCVQSVASDVEVVGYL